MLSSLSFSVTGPWCIGQVGGGAGWCIGQLGGGDGVLSSAGWCIGQPGGGVIGDSAILSSTNKKTKILEQRSVGMHAHSQRNSFIGAGKDE